MSISVIKKKGAFFESIFKYFSMFGHRFSSIAYTFCIIQLLCSCKTDYTKEPEQMLVDFQSFIEKDDWKSIADRCLFVTQTGLESVSNNESNSFTFEMPQWYLIYPMGEYVLTDKMLDKFIESNQGENKLKSKDLAYTDIVYKNRKENRILVKVINKNILFGNAEKYFCFVVHEDKVFLLLDLYVDRKQKYKFDPFNGFLPVLRDPYYVYRDNYGFKEITETITPEMWLEIGLDGINKKLENLY